MLERYQSTPQPDSTAPEQEPQSAVSSDPGAELSDSLWYVRNAPEHDEEKFQRLLAAMREQYARPDFNQEVIAWDDHTVSGLTTYPFKEQFTPDGLLRYASVIRGPFTSNGRLTLGGRSRAKFLLCRERMLLGTVTSREPDWLAIKDYLPPSLYEIKVRAGIAKERNS